MNDLKLLITPTYVKKYSVVDENVDDNIIQKFIIKAQTSNGKQILGENLYKRLMNEFPNYTGKSLDLVEMVQTALLGWTLYHMLPHINYKLTNKSVQTKSSEFGQPVGLDEVKWLRDQHRDQAEFDSERVRDFIKNNQVEFPEFLTKDQMYEIRPNKTNYFSGIRTSGRRNSVPPANRPNIDPCNDCD